MYFIKFIDLVCKAFIDLWRKVERPENERMLAMLVWLSYISDVFYRAKKCNFEVITAEFFNCSVSQQSIFYVRTRNVTRCERIIQLKCSAILVQEIKFIKSFLFTKFHSKVFRIIPSRVQSSLFSNQTLSILWNISCSH